MTRHEGPSQQPGGWGQGQIRFREISIFLRPKCRGSVHTGHFYVSLWAAAHTCLLVCRVSLPQQGSCTQGRPSTLPLRTQPLAETFLPQEKCGAWLRALLLVTHQETLKSPEVRSKHDFVWVTRDHGLLILLFIHLGNEISGSFIMGNTSSARQHPVLPLFWSQEHLADPRHPVRSVGYEQKRCVSPKLDP